SGATHDPHSVLGAHPTDSSTTIRTLRRGAGDATARADRVGGRCQKS
ncbi:GlgB N-terminal domain-containing protein, partial [Micromonospora sp. NPDC002411]